MKANRLFFILIRPAMIILLSPFIAAQQNPDSLIPRIVIPNNQVIEYGRDKRIAMIHQLMAQGAYISAANLLETYYEETPDNQEIGVLLLACYTELKDYGKAELLLKRLRELNPTNYGYYYEMLQLYLRMGADSSANKEIDLILEKFPGNPDIHSSVIRILLNYNNVDGGKKLIEEGRRIYGKDYLFALEAGSVYETQGAYYDAVLEYFKAIRGDSSRAAEADRKIAALIRYPGAPPEVVRALKTILAGNSSDVSALRMLEEAYVKNNQFAEAFDISIHLDSLNARGGQELFQYLRQCRERKLYDQVVKAAEYIDRKYPGDALLSQYRFFYGEALAALGKYEPAISTYSQIAANYPQLRDRASALLAIGNIFRYYLNSYDSARVYYDSVANTYIFVPFNGAARMEIAKLFLVKGQLDSATTGFSELKSGRLTDDDREFVDYNLALIEFYQHQFDSANVSFRKLIASYPRGLYVNDALMKSLIIGEAAGVSLDILSTYADALYFEDRLMPDSAEARLKWIIDQGDTPILGQTTYELALYYAGQKGALNALLVIDEMEKQNSGNYFFPYCLKLKADIIIDMADRKGEAADIYKTILEKFGNYPFVGEIREKLQKLEGYRLPG